MGLPRLRLAGSACLRAGASADAEAGPARRRRWRTVDVPTAHPIPSMQGGLGGAGAAATPASNDARRSRRPACEAGSRPSGPGRISAAAFIRSVQHARATAGPVPRESGAVHQFGSGTALRRHPPHRPGRRWRRARCPADRPVRLIQHQGGAQGAGDRAGWRWTGRTPACAGPPATSDWLSVSRQVGLLAVRRRVGKRSRAARAEAAMMGAVRLLAAGAAGAGRRPGCRPDKDVSVSRAVRRRPRSATAAVIDGVAVQGHFDRARSAPGCVRGFRMCGVRTARLQIVGCVRRRS